MEDLDIPALLMRALQWNGVATIVHLERRADEAQLALRFLDAADIPLLRAAVQAYWQRIGDHAESAPSPTDGRAVDIWMRRQQGVSVDRLSATLGVSGAYVCQMTERGARYVRSQDSPAQHEQELPPPPQYLSIREVAAVLGLSPDTVRKCIKDGTIATVKMGVRIHKIPLAEVDRYRNTQQGRERQNSTRISNTDERHTSRGQSRAENI